MPPLRSKKLIVSTIILFIFLTINSLYILNIKSDIENDAATINNAGKIRGLIQRITKLALLNSLKLDLLDQVDSLFLYMSHDEDFLHDKISKDHINNMYNKWVYYKIALKNYQHKSDDITKEQLKTMSEEFWDLGEQLVLLAQQHSEKKINYFKIALVFLLINLFIILIIIYMIKHYVGDKLEYEAYYDPLTNIYNKRSFEHFLQHELNRAKRYNNKLSLIMFDIDHFKNVNDEYGHSIGDHVLKDLARIVKEHIRESDVLARVGGEEFAIVSPETPRDSAINLAEDLRKMVKDFFKAEIVTGINEPINLTISLGVAEHKPGEKKGKLYQRADQALYQAKDNGRDRVEEMG